MRKDLPALNRARLLLSAALLCVAASVGAQQPARSYQVLVSRITGTINQKTLDSLFITAERVRDEAFPAGWVLLVDSAGGDGMAAMRIGRLAREHKAHVFVSGICESACVMVLAGGVVRSAPDGAIGLHRGRLTRFEPGVGLVNADLAQAEPKAVLEQFEREAKAYFEEMGLPAEMFRSMQAIPSDGIRHLTRDEAQRLGLVRVEPAYARQRLAVEQKSNLDEAGLASRMLSAQSACPVAGPSGPFVQCYADVVMGRAGR